MRTGILRKEAENGKIAGHEVELHNLGISRGGCLLSAFSKSSKRTMSGSFTSSRTKLIRLGSSFQRFRMTLLLGPPASGKTTLLLSLAGKLDKELRLYQISGRTYCGHEISKFFPQRTCAYISQHDLHNPETTVRGDSIFSGRCLGVGTRYEMVPELSRREKDAGIKPNPEIDAFMKATALEGQKTSLATDYILKLIPIWWRWYYWVTPLAWTIHGIVVSQLGDKDNLVGIPGESSMQVNDFLKEKLGFEHSLLGYAAAVHLGFVLAFVFVFAYSTKYLNFQNI